MSVKHVKDYFNSLTKDYIDTKDTIEKLQSEITEEQSKEALNNLQNLKDRFAVIETNYKRVSYIMYLLDMPNKAKKKKRYEQMYKKLDKSLDGHKLEDIKKENKQALSYISAFV